jgi:hypothetical protein
MIPPHRGMDIVMKDEEGRMRINTGMAVPQLFNLAEDPGEAKNVAKDHPDMVKDLTGLLTTIGDQKLAASRPPQ